MSIEHLKKQAKKLSRLLPDHLKSNENPAALSACQELVAQINGYSSFHTAIAREPEKTSSTSNLSNLIRDEEPLVEVAPIQSQPRDHVIEVDATPWMLESKELHTKKDPERLTSGQVETIKYWVADFGVIPNSTPRTTLRALVVLSNDSYRDSQSRAQIISVILNNIYHSDPKFVAPDMFVSLDVGSSYNGMCYSFSADQKNGCIFLDEKSKDAILNRLGDIGILRPYERYILRSGFEKLETKSAPDSFSPMNKEAFKSILNAVNSSFHLFVQGRSFGVKMNVDVDSWIYRSIADILRYCPEMYVIWVNITNQRVSQTRINYVKKPGIIRSLFGKMAA